MADRLHQMRNQLSERPSDELLDLIWGLCQGTLDHEGISRLNDLLMADKKSRADYVDFLQVAAWLEFDQPAVHGSTSIKALDRVGPPRDFAAEMLCNVVPVRASSELSPSFGGAGKATPACVIEKSMFWRAKRVLTVATCAALVAILAGFAFRYPAERGMGVVEVADPSAIEEPVDIIAVRLATAESRTLPIGDFGTVSIQGPANFELIGATRARLKHGRVKIRINDERGHGFVLETPRGIVTDLGTEFGVDVADDSDTGVMVFEGMVDLAVPSEKDRQVLRVERLIQGEGLALRSAGRLDRIMSVITGNVSTFQQQGERWSGAKARLIADVYDNIRTEGFKNFYEIVPGGLREDALAYADRPEHDWNGIDAKGMPAYLIGADYVKPFNSDKMRGDLEISVTLAAPARLFVLLDDRVSPPDWLRNTFRDTGDDIGLDCGVYSIDGIEFNGFARAEGPGNSLDVTFSVFEKTVHRADLIRLGPNLGGSDLTGMYAIAAIPLGEEGDDY